MLTRSGLVGKISSRLHLGPFRQFSHGLKKSTKCSKSAYLPWWAYGPYSPGSALAAIHPVWGNTCQADVYGAAAHFFVGWHSRFANLQICGAAFPPGRGLFVTSWFVVQPWLGGGLPWRKKTSFLVDFGFL